jgi:hypothetical protein
VVSALPLVGPRPNCEPIRTVALRCGNTNERCLETYGHLCEESSKDTCDVMRGEVVVFPLNVLAILRNGQLRRWCGRH